MFSNFRKLIRNYHRLQQRKLKKQKNQKMEKNSKFDNNFLTCTCLDFKVVCVLYCVILFSCIIIVDSEDETRQLSMIYCLNVDILIQHKTKKKQEKIYLHNMYSKTEPTWQQQLFNTFTNLVHNWRKFIRRKKIQSWYKSSLVILNLTFYIFFVAQWNKGLEVARYILNALNRFQCNARI